MFFQKNLPLWERLLRTCLGLLVAGLGFLAAPGSIMAWAAYASGAVLVVTGFVGFCPMCALAGRRLKRAH